MRACVCVRAHVPLNHIDGQKHSWRCFDVHNLNWQTSSSQTAYSGSQEQILLGSKQDDFLAEFKSKFSSIDPDQLKGLLLIDLELQETSAMRFFKCSVDCARYALLQAKILKDKERQQQLQEIRRHEIELERAKSRDKNPLSTSGFPHENLVEKFCKLIGRPLSDQESTIFFTKFSNFHLLIQAGNMKVATARKMLQQIHCILNTNTLQQMLMRGYVFDGLLGSIDAGRAVMYRIIKTSTLDVFAGKVYLVNGDEHRAMKNEISACQIIHGAGPKANVVQFHAVIEFSHYLHNVNSVALVMPLYCISLSELLQAFYGNAMDFSMFLIIAKGLFAAGESFETCGLAHCDIKPSNIMMDKAVPVLIDLGGTVKLGCSIEEYTRFFSLDADSSIATPAFDLNCIVVTLAMCFVPNFEIRFRTRQMLRTELEGLEGALKKYAMICVHALDFDSCSSARAGLTTMLQGGL
jgi:hypothetical protein